MRTDTCPHCGAVHDDATDMRDPTSNHQPADGDAVMCVECGELYISGTPPRKATADDLKGASPELIRVMLLAKAFRLEYIRLHK